MTLLRGHFAMMLLCSDEGAPARVAPSEIEHALALVDRRRRSRGVRAPGDRRAAAPATGGSPWVLTVHGGDRPGIVSAVVREVAAAGGNITDLTTRLAGDLDPLIAEIDLPVGVLTEAALEASIKAASGVAADLGVGASLRPGLHLMSRERSPAPSTTGSPPGARPSSASRAGCWTSSVPLRPCCRRPGGAARPHLAGRRPARRRPGRHHAGQPLAGVGLAAPQVGGRRDGSSASTSPPHPKTREHHGTFVLCNAEVVESSAQREGPRGLQCERPRPHLRREARVAHRRPRGAPGHRRAGRGRGRRVRGACPAARSTRTTAPGLLFPRPRRRRPRRLRSPDFLPHPLLTPRRPLYPNRREEAVLKTAAQSGFELLPEHDAPTQALAFRST